MIYLMTIMAYSLVSLAARCWIGFVNKPTHLHVLDDLSGRELDPDI